VSLNRGNDAVSGKTNPDIVDQGRPTGSSADAANQPNRSTKTPVLESWHILYHVQLTSLVVTVLECRIVPSSFQLFLLNNCRLKRAMRPAQKPSRPG
jgi:hypothetical protein